ncbi:LysR family transcriptional regulator [Vibrio hannami]|uniref:LysR family transcriptional regulator n=1 Tax=Vibrio hannami TaxID=2717094 RepID=UPI00240F3E32|nr:LysR family transcriptional regulator [Vibrio hannami]MDG3085563.1 LysR family transcriptional regulator [Vibrio hannami]
MKNIPTQLPIYIEVCKELSFSAAARNLGISTPAVSKAISRLEKDLGVKLVNRSPHSLSLTSAGEVFYQNLQPTLKDLFASINIAQQSKNTLSGTIKINLPSTSLGVDTVLPHLESFAYNYPDIKLDLRFNDDVVDLITHGFDIGIGTYINHDSRIIAKKIFMGQGGLFASTDYLKKYGSPENIGELQQHRCIPIRSLSNGKTRSIKLVDDGNEKLFVPEGSITVDSFLAGKQLLLSGWGILGIGEWAVKKELLDQNIVPVLKDYWGSKIPIYLYFSSRDHMPLSTRTLIDHLSSIEA